MKEKTEYHLFEITMWKKDWKVIPFWARFRLKLNQFLLGKSFVHFVVNSPQNERLTRGVVGASRNRAGSHSGSEDTKKFADVWTKWAKRKKGGKLK